MQAPIVGVAEAGEGEYLSHPPLWRAELIVLKGGAFPGRFYDQA
jgi:hypothetical protein